MSYAEICFNLLGQETSDFAVWQSLKLFHKNVSMSQSIFMLSAKSIFIAMNPINVFLSSHFGTFILVICMSRCAREVHINFMTRLRDKFFCYCTLLVHEQGNTGNSFHQVTVMSAVWHQIALTANN